MKTGEGILGSMREKREQGRAFLVKFSQFLMQNEKVA